MSPKLLILWTDSSQDSREAKAILGKAGFRFQEVQNPPEATGQKLPQLISSRGEFPGLDLIRWYADTFSAAPATS
jgi:hypothetical protein